MRTLFGKEISDDELKRLYERRFKVDNIKNSDTLGLLCVVIQPTDKVIEVTETEVLLMLQELEKISFINEKQFSNLATLLRLFYYTDLNSSVGDAYEGKFILSGLGKEARLDYASILSESEKNKIIDAWKKVKEMIRKYE